MIPDALAAALDAAGRGDLAALHGCVDWRLSAAPTVTGTLARYDLAIGFAALAEVTAQLERDATDPSSADLGLLATALASHRSVTRAGAAQARDILADLIAPPLAPDAPLDLRRYFDALAARAATLTEVWVVETADRRLPVAVTPDSGQLVLPLSTRAYDLGRPAPAPLSDAGTAPEVLVRLVEAAKYGSPESVARLIDWPLSGAPGIAAVVLSSDHPSRLTGPAAGLAELAAAAERPRIALDVVAELDDTLAGATAIVPAGPDERRATLDALRIPELPADLPGDATAEFDRLRTRAGRLTDAWIVTGPASHRAYAVAPDTGLAVVRVD